MHGSTDFFSVPELVSYYMLPYIDQNWVTHHPYTIHKALTVMVVSLSGHVFGLALSFFPSERK